MSDLFKQYTSDYISGVMSLRKPQEKSLKILENILSNVEIKKGMDLNIALEKVHKLYPTCTDFEREFMSLTFALATGVGKTRLMGAFIAYLYTQYNIKNFFVVAPSKTVYDKLRRDLSDPSNPKYVFKGLGCFNKAPEIITDDDYRTKTISTFKSDVRVFVYNIDKFNKESSNMKKINETLGDSFYEYLANLEDLVMIMDESHHYRAERGMQALNDLRPILGLELTATPLVNTGAKQEAFKNVVYEYPLSQSIKDGYTRTPFAGTRSNVNFSNFGEEEVDKLMLIDGIKLHQRAKSELEAYYLRNNTEENPIKKVKPFMMVVCKDTDHAQWVESFIKSNEFAQGKYKNKTIVIHSKQTGTESDENTKLLLGVEDYNNPIEIVIHVNMLKEGWDVNNLYTIVPLRTAASKILREQMVGRGLRLPYGKRTGNTIVDAVYLTAHDKFQDIIKEAKKGDSLFKAGNVIHIEDIEDEENFSTSNVNIDIEKVEESSNKYNFGTAENNQVIVNVVIDETKKEVIDEINKTKNTSIAKENKKEISKRVISRIKNHQLIGQTSIDDEELVKSFVSDAIDKIEASVKRKYIPIPQLKIIDEGSIKYGFVDFDLNTGDFNYMVEKSEIVIQNLIKFSESERLGTDNIKYKDINPKKLLLTELRAKPEIDYENCSDLLFKLISQACDYLCKKYDEDSMKNIVIMNKKDIANKIYMQMTSDEHFYCENGDIKYSVSESRAYNYQQVHTFKEKHDLYEDYDGNIKSILFEGIEKAVFDIAKFDSYQELDLARILEKDDFVINWLRPSQNDFNLIYNRDKHYVPDFVVESEEHIYLVEVKGEDRINSADVIAKSKKAIEFCDEASSWARANNQKDWSYVFIPSKEIHPNLTFESLAKRFIRKINNI